MINRSSLLAAAALTVFAVIGVTVVAEQDPPKPPLVVSLEQMYPPAQAEVVVPVQPARLSTQTN